MIDLHEGVLELFAEAQALAPRRLSLPEHERASWGLEVVRRRRLREGERLLRAMVQPLQTRTVAPLSRVMRWCPTCGGRHETTHSADSWRRWHKSVCAALGRKQA